MPIPKCVKEEAEQHSLVSFHIQRDGDGTPDYSREMDRGKLNPYGQKISKSYVYKKPRNSSFFFKHLPLCSVLITKKALVKRLQACAYSLIGKAIAMY